ncbi:MAG: hypothetical protein WDO19_04015 [Bacteroidota bacterium]
MPRVFRKGNNEKLCVKPLDAYIYHYGWVREPKAMQNKALGVFKYWSEENPDPQKLKFDEDEFDYKRIDVLKKFTGTHPSVMKERVANKNWQFDYDISKNKLTLKDRFKIRWKKLPVNVSLIIKITASYN